MNGSQAKEEVSQLIQGLCAILEEKRATLLQAIEECQQERLGSLHCQIQEHQAMLENSGMVGYAQEVLKETDQPCFVQAAKQLHNRYQAGGDPGRHGAAGGDEGSLVPKAPAVFHCDASFVPQDPQGHRLAAELPSCSHSLLQPLPAGRQQGAEAAHRPGLHPR